jgi:uncharacterized membrane protein YjjP (DUF1212 family)
MKDSFEDYLNLALKLSITMLKNGGETYRAEECARNILLASGAEGIQILALPTAITVTAEYEGKSYTKVCSIKTRSNDLGNIDALNTISREVSARKITPDAALKRLKEVEDGKPAFFIRSVYSSISSAAFAVMFSGGIAEFFLAMLVAFIAQMFLLVLKRIGSITFFANLGGSMITALLARLCVFLFPEINMSSIIIGGIMTLLPGLAMVNAIRDTLYGDIVSGTARGVEALLSAVSIAAGVGLTLAF